MIIGRNLRELNNYRGLNDHLDTAIEFITTHNLADHLPGKYPIQDISVVLSREDYLPKDISECYFENHHQYIDIHIVMAGEEGFGYADLNENRSVTHPYDDGTDIAKFKTEPELIVPMKTGCFVIVFPEDLHMPKIKTSSSGIVKKAVFKVKL